MFGTDEDVFGASQALLTAALGGLLCVAPGCGGSSTSGSSGGSTDTSTGTSVAIPTDGGPATVTVTLTPNGDTPKPDTGCRDGVLSDPQVNSRVVATMTQDDFTAQCATRNGIFEIQPNCGGSNACRGMSYDSNTTTLTEHSCRATNTCAGMSCVTCN